MNKLSILERYGLVLKKRYLEVTDADDLFGSYSIWNGCNFTVDNGTISSNGTAGWLLSKNTYNDMSFTVNFSEAASHNPYGDKDLKNALIIGANEDNDGGFSGYLIDVCTSFIDVFWFNSMSAGSRLQMDNIYLAGDYSRQDLSFSMENSHLTIKAQNGSVILDNELRFYTPGQIGFWNTNLTNGQLTISNFSYSVSEPNSLFANCYYNEGNDWTVSDYGNTITSSSTAGWALTYDSYFELALKVTPKGVESTNNTWATGVASNAIIIGGKVSDDGKLSGYLIEFHQNFVMAAQLVGDGTYNTVWQGSDQYLFNHLTLDCTHNPVYIIVKNTVKYGPQIAYYCGGQGLEVILGDSYTGGSIGYLCNGEGNKTIDTSLLYFSR